MLIHGHDSFVLISSIALALAPLSVSFLIHPNCKQWKDEPANTETYLHALQQIVPSANHIVKNSQLETTGNWIDDIKDDVEAKYNEAAHSASAQLTSANGWLNAIQGFDWNTGPAAPRKDKTRRDLPDGSIMINCVPESLKTTVTRDYPSGIYLDSTVNEYHLINDGMGACISGSGNNPSIIYVQRTQVGQPGQPGSRTYFVVFICKAAKDSGYFDGSLIIQNHLKSLAEVFSATLFQEQVKDPNTVWNLGLAWNVQRFLYLDIIFVAAMYAIAQQRGDYTVFNPLTSGDLWDACFQKQGQYWSDPVCLSLWTFTTNLLTNGIIINSAGNMGKAWNAPTLVAAPPPPNVD